MVWRLCPIFQSMPDEARDQRIVVVSRPLKSELEDWLGGSL